MNCKYCQSPLEDENSICPVCGKDNAEPEQMQPPVEAAAEKVIDDGEVTEVIEEVTDDEQGTDVIEEVTGDEQGTDVIEEVEVVEDVENADEDADETAEDEKSDADAKPAKPAKAKKKKLVWLFVLLGIIAALVVAVLAYYTVYVIQNKDALSTKTTNEAGEITESKLTFANVMTGIGDANKAIAHRVEIVFNPYATIVTDKEVYAIDTATPNDKRMQKVVAVCGDSELTSAQFQIYYMTQYFNFLNNYGSYASMFGLDTTKPLSGQPSMSENMSWEQYFVEATVSQYKDYAAACAQADAENYEIDPEFTTFLEGLPAQLETEAVNAGFENALAYIQKNFGPGVTVADYVSYVKTYYTAMLYENSLYSGIEYTDEDISAYYDANVETYQADGVEKLDVNNINVRHILIKPEDADSDGTSTDEEWATAEKKAQELYDTYLKDATEDNFATLAGENSSDEGSSSNGGLYEDVSPGKMTSAFNDWCFDTARKAGDTGIVKTEYGYHIMYFVGESETVHWFETALADYQKEKMETILADMQAAYPTKINYKAITLVEVPMT